MSGFAHQQGRRKIYFTDHALDRWWDRCEANGFNGRKKAMDLLRERLANAVFYRGVPGWAHLSLWHRAQAEGFLLLDPEDEAGFVVNINASGDRVAVTYITRSTILPKVSS